VTKDTNLCLILKNVNKKIRVKQIGGYNIRTPRNIYVLNEIGKEKCCLGKEDEIWLWHKRMGHINFDNLVKVRKREAVREIPRDLKANKHSMQALSTGKTNQDKVQVKGILHNKATRDCTYQSSWTEKNKGIER
jgi:hypothetical protein